MQITLEDFQELEAFSPKTAYDVLSFLVEIGLAEEGAAIVRGRVRTVYSLGPVIMKAMRIQEDPATQKGSAQAA
jgi:hypothetical protein